MTYVLMFVSIALMLLSNWLGFTTIARYFACGFLATLLELIITEAVAAGIKRARLTESLDSMTASLESLTASLTESSREEQ